MKTTKSLAIFATLVTLFISCGETPSEKQDSNEAPTEAIAQTQSNIQVLRTSDLKLQTVENGTVSNYMSITGRVIPKYTTDLVAEVQGRIMNTNKSFKAGTRYQKGETILRIDAREFALNLESQKSAFLNILTGLMPDLKADYPDNYQNWLNYVNAYKTGESLKPLPQTKSNPEKYFVTSRQVYNTYFNIKAQEERLSKFTLRAPYSGSISVAMVDNGGLVSPGQTLGTFISDTDYEIESAVSLALAEALKVGQHIDFKNKTLNKTFTATVTRINNIVDPNTQNIPVYLKVKDPSLRSGMYLEGQVLYAAFDNAVTIPAKAINRDNTVHIFKNGIIKKQPVEVVSTNAETAIVKGIENKAQLVLNTFDNPVSGLKITQ